MADDPKPDDAPALSPTAEIARLHRTELPAGWEHHFASEEAALASYDSSAPASAPGMTKLEADGPSLHALGAVAPSGHPPGGNAPGQERFFEVRDQRLADEAKARDDAAKAQAKTDAAKAKTAPGG